MKLKLYWVSLILWYPVHISAPCCRMYCVTVFGWLRRLSKRTKNQDNSWIQSTVNSGAAESVCRKGLYGKNWSDTCALKENTWSLVLPNLGFKLVLNLLPLHLLLPLLLCHLQFCLLLLLLVCASLLPSCYYSSFLFFLNSFIMKYDMWSREYIRLEVWFKGLL